MKHFTDSIDIHLPAQSGVRIDAAAYGAKPGPGSCNTQAFRSAVAQCKAQPGSTLVMPQGVYHFYDAPGGVHLPLHDVTDLTIDGRGSELIFHTPVAYWELLRCTRVHLKNLILDWAWEDAPLASVGVVRQIAEDGSWIEVAFPAYEAVAETMEIRIVGPFDPYRYTPGYPGGIEFRPYKNEHIHPAGDAATDEEMGHLVRELSNILLPGAQRTGANTLKLSTQNPAWAKRHFAPDQCYNFRHFEYDGVAVRTGDSSHITLERVTIYGCPGHGFLSSGNVHHLHFDHCRILPRPGTPRSVSVSVDCLHVGNSQGWFIIEDCDFSGAGDDCINLHDNSSMGVRRLSAHQLLALRVQERTLQFAPGSKIELRRPDLSPIGYTSLVTAAEYHEAERTCILTLEDPLPEELDPESIVFNRSFHTDHYIIRNCRFTNNRARGALLQGSHGLVENNLFENLQGAAIQIETGCENRWSEGQGVTDLLIQKNIIRHCDLNAWQMAVIYMGVYLPAGRTDYPIFQDVEICHNTIIDCPRLAGFFSSCRNVQIHDNTIINPAQLNYEDTCYGSSTMEAPIYGERYEGVIQFTHSQDCVEENNQVFYTVGQARL